MQTVRGVPNTQKWRAVIRSVYSIEFNGEFAITGCPRHPKRDVTDTGKLNSIARYWERAIVILTLNLCKVKSMDDNCGEWVECMGVVSRWVWLVGVGGIYGCG